MQLPLLKQQIQHIQVLLEFRRVPPPHDALHCSNGPHALHTMEKVKQYFVPWLHIFTLSLQIKFNCIQWRSQGEKEF